MTRKSNKLPKKRKESSGPPGGEVAHLAFLYWEETHGRFELKIDNVLKGYSSGELGHAEGKAVLRKIAEDKGYTVLETDT